MESRGIQLESRFHTISIVQGNVSFVNRVNLDVYEKPESILNRKIVSSRGLPIVTYHWEPAPTKKMETKKILTQEIILTSKAPLKILELLETCDTNGSIDSCLVNEVCKYLKNRGKDLDNETHRKAFNHYFTIIRNLSRDVSLDLASRGKLLEIIELRARKWNQGKKDGWQSTHVSAHNSVTPAPVNLSTIATRPSCSQILRALSTKSNQGSNNDDRSRKLVYDRDFLVRCADSDLCKQAPAGLKLFTETVPEIARKPGQLRANSVESC